MFCEHCGAELPEGTEICTECGKPTREPDLSEEVSAPSRRKSARAKKKKTPITRKQLILIGSGAAALVLAVVIIIVIALGGYKRPVRNFFAAKAIQLLFDWKRSPCLDFGLEMFDLRVLFD